MQGSMGNGLCLFGFHSVFWFTPTIRLQTRHCLSSVSAVYTHTHAHSHIYTHTNTQKVRRHSIDVSTCNTPGVFLFKLELFTFCVFYNLPQIYKNLCLIYHTEELQKKVWRNFVQCLRILKHKIMF